MQLLVLCLLLRLTWLTLWQGTSYDDDDGDDDYSDNGDDGDSGGDGEGGDGDVDGDGDDGFRLTWLTLWQGPARHHFVKPTQNLIKMRPDATF